MVDQDLALHSCTMSAEPEDFERGGESNKETILVQKDLSLTSNANVLCGQAEMVHL